MGESGLSSDDVRASRKEQCRFHMSMKLLKMAVIVARSNRGVGMSNVANMGVRKCCRASHELESMR